MYCIRYSRLFHLCLSHKGGARILVQGGGTRGAARIRVKGGGGNHFQKLSVRKTWAFNKPPQVGILSAPCCRYSRHYLILKQQKRDLSAHYYVVLTGFCVQGRSQTCDRKGQRGGNRKSFNFEKYLQNLNNFE